MALVLSALIHGEDRHRVLGMRRVFRRNRDNLAAVMFVAQKNKAGLQ